MRRISEYLHIPDNHPVNWGSLCWSAGGDAIERPDGSTFAFASEIGLFLEGYASVGPLIQFPYILALFRRFDSKLTESEGSILTTTAPGRALVMRSIDLAIAFREARRPIRNAGALAAWLCREIPPDPDPPDAAELCLRLSNRTLMSELAVQRVATTLLGFEFETPVLGMFDFETWYLGELIRLSPDEVACWLRHGRGPLPDPGDRVAEVITSLKPRTLGGTLAALEGRERLAGALPMVAQLVSALTLPPRRLGHRALPTGGYADVANRGRPEQILPSQFAVDDIEFLRRFAENELLYFHREEPHTPLTEELVLLIDQGVRTWGRVRHALVASALAFARLAGRRKLRMLVGGTSSGGRLFDPLQIDDEALGVLWESSDLSANPSLALEQVLETSGAGRRDVVVLSHPRSVAEPDFAAAGRRATADTRVFSVAIDEPGQVQFREWRRGVPVKLGDFRVDFSPPRGSGPVPRPTGPDPRGWKGDVEPVPFPFRFGVIHRIERPLFDFDHASRWLLLCTHRGMLHAWKLDGSRAEILPRAMIDGEVLEDVDAVLGVAGGFVVGGRVGKSLVAMHYDFGSRTARANVLGPTFEGEWIWSYSREQHTLVVRRKDNYRALDLSTREVHLSHGPIAQPSIRATLALDQAANSHLQPPGLAIRQEGVPGPIEGSVVALDRSTGTLILSGVVPAWEPFQPISDGLPTLRNRWLDSAQLRGDVLALVVSRPGQQTMIRLFHHPSGMPNCEMLPSSADPSSLILSPDGRLIARKLGERQLEVRETAGVGRPIFVTDKGKTHSDPKVTLGRYGMIIHVGKYVSLIRWDGDKLTVSTVNEGSTRSEHDIVSWPLDRPATRATPLPPPLDHDPRRFVACARAELTAVVDVFGQVSLFDAQDRLIAMFLAFRSQVAAWTPDGTRFGPTLSPFPLIYGPVTPNAAEIIGRALKEASDASARPAKPSPKG